MTNIRYAVAPTSLGALLVAATDRGVCAIALGDDPSAVEAEARRRFPNAAVTDINGEFGEWVTQAVSLAESPSRVSGLPLDVGGTAFQQSVWALLRRIPAGRTSSYSELARELGVPGAARAVARACASNPVALAVPCHRVIRGDGSLAGYRWGVERKAELLRREAAKRD